MFIPSWAIFTLSCIVVTWIIFMVREIRLFYMNKGGK